ncbi:hypothetical protein BMAFMH_K0055 [Burkholderia mallei FMH]|nr:hypothetical protein BMAFMH_K0055 [Burkholderia mallei FMH]
MACIHRASFGWRCAGERMTRHGSRCGRPCAKPRRGRRRFPRASIACVDDH